MDGCAALDCTARLPAARVVLCCVVLCVGSSSFPVVVQWWKPSATRHVMVSLVDHPARDVSTDVRVGLKRPTVSRPSTSERVPTASLLNLLIYCMRKTATERPHHASITPLSRAKSMIIYSSCPHADWPAQRLDCSWVSTASSSRRFAGPACINRFGFEMDDTVTDVRHAPASSLMLGKHVQLLHRIPIR